jgi:hypothetical protein
MSGGIELETLEPEAYASFSDDTRTDSRLSLGFRASITAQVLPGAPLDWYYDLVRCLSYGAGNEVKSEIVVERFGLLSREIQQKVWSGLSNVRIHIFDAMPFALEISDIFRSLIGSPFPLKVLRHLRKSRELSVRSEARRLSSLANAYVRDRVIQSFPGERLSERLETSVFDIFEKSELLGSAAPHRRDLRRRPLAASTLDEFVELHDVDRALAEGAKSTATLTDAEKRLYESVESANGWPVLPLTPRERFEIVREVNKTHVFDEGDERTLRAVDEQRRRVLEAASGAMGGVLTQDLKGVRRVSSTSSIHVQAADVAAGFARHLYERDQLIGVIRRFKHVSFNGERVDENNLQEAMGRMAFVVIG